MASASEKAAEAMETTRRTGLRSRGAKAAGAKSVRAMAASAKAQISTAAPTAGKTLKRRVSSQSIGARISADVPA